VPKVVQFYLLHREKKKRKLITGTEKDGNLGECVKKAWSSLTGKRRKRRIGKGLTSTDLRARRKWKGFCTLPYDGGEGQRDRSEPDVTVTCNSSSTW